MWDLNQTNANTKTSEQQTSEKRNPCNNNQTSSSCLQKYQKSRTTQKSNCCSQGFNMGFNMFQPYRLPLKMEEIEMALQRFDPHLVGPSSESLQCRSNPSRLLQWPQRPRRRTSHLKQIGWIGWVVHGSPMVHGSPIPTYCIPTYSDNRLVSGKMLINITRLPPLRQTHLLPPQMKDRIKRQCVSLLST